MDQTPLDILITGRRSIRKYTAELPPEELIKKMILAAMQAPSPTNSQPVRFIRIISPQVREDLHQAMVRGRERLLEAIKDSSSSKRLKNWVNAYLRFSEFMFTAPVLFAVGTTLTFVSLSEGSSARHDGAGPQEAQRRGYCHSLALKGYLLKGEELRPWFLHTYAPLIFIEEPEKILFVEKIRYQMFCYKGYPDEEAGYIKKKSFNEIYREI